MMRRLQHEKQNRNSFCLCEITLRTMRLIQNRYTPKVPSRGQSLLRNSTSSVFQSKKRNASVQLPQHNPLQKTSNLKLETKTSETSEASDSVHLSQHNPMQENLGVALCKILIIPKSVAKN